MEFENEPIVSRENGARAVIAALRHCWEKNENGWNPSFFDGDRHQGVFEYMQTADWEPTYTEANLVGGKIKNADFEDLDHCLLALALAVTISGVNPKDVL
jgi:hypothetical protein